MTEESPDAARCRGLRRVCAVLLPAATFVLFLVQRGIDRAPGAPREFADVLFFPSGAALRRLSLGHEGLLADIYWTRAVQYFGRKRLAQDTRLDLMGPLLRITTDLDPHLIVAYRYGSVFLAEKPPWGAGEPEEALQLLRQGIVANPDAWRLWADLGFVYYWDLKDYASAARIFRVGSERPGAKVWMRVLAATVAAKGGEIESSRLLWSQIYDNADNEQVRESARAHLQALDAVEQMSRLNAVLDRYREREGRPARSFSELVVAGFLRGIPQDPSGVPYAVGGDGRTALARESNVDIRTLE